MKYFSSYLCLIILSITMASCDKFFGEELTDLIFDHGKFEMNDKDLFILELSEKLPARQMVVAFNESLPVSQAAKQFMDML